MTPSALSKAKRGLLGAPVGQPEQQRALAWRSCTAVLVAGLLGACGQDLEVEQTRSESAPSVAADPSASATAADENAIRQSVPGRVLDPSVPPAETVLRSAGEGSAGGTLRSPADPQALTPRDQAVAMPLPGQANDHSTPSAPAASGARPAN